jgi:hypothetical protein
MKYVVVLLIVMFTVGLAFYVVPNRNTSQEYQGSELLKPPESKISYQKAFLFLPVFREGSTPLHIIKASGNGANTITIGITAKTVGNDLELPNWEMQKQVSKELAQEAYRNSMHVEVRILGDPAGNRVTDYEAMSRNAKPIVEEVAKFAEEIDAWRFGIFGEIDNGWVMGSDKNATDVFVQEVLPIVRTHFSGEIGMGFCCNLAPHNITGYDYVLLSINPGGYKDKETWLAGIPGTIHSVKEWAASYQVDNLVIGEVGFLTEGEAANFPEAKLFTWVLEEDEEAHIYARLIDSTKDLAAGYTFYYGLPILSVKGKKSEGIVKQFFTSY